MSVACTFAPAAANASAEARPMPCAAAVMRTVFPSSVFVMSYPRLVLAVRSVAMEDLFHHRSEEHTSELQSLMRISYAVFCLKKKEKQKQQSTSPSTKYR